eukprot:COSAG01_NODE_17206_length_1170_cov_1.497666_2_plen_56_part_00
MNRVVANFQEPLCNDRIGLLVVKALGNAVGRLPQAIDVAAKDLPADAWAASFDRR